MARDDRRADVKHFRVRVSVGYLDLRLGLGLGLGLAVARAAPLMMITSPDLGRWPTHTTRTGGTRSPAARLGALMVTIVGLGLGFGLG